MLREAIFHYCGGAYAYPTGKDILLVQLRAAKDDLQSVQLVYGDRYRGADVSERIFMDKYASDLLFDYFRVEIRVETRRFRYLFLLDDGQERLWFNEFGFHTARPLGYHSGYFHYPYICDADDFDIPDWVRDAVVYEIFPERFFNGCRSNDPEGVLQWGEKPTNQTDFFGGDLAGIIAKLPYLEELGINTLYLTPVFEAVTNHKYDTTNYYKIDPRFGDHETFRKLVQDCHQRGIRIILDAVFNHCGYEMEQFQDVLKHGSASPYKDWFYIHQFPVSTEPNSYEAFADVAWRMPKLRTANPEVRKFLIGVAEYWIREYDIDGWRLDVANEIDHAFWREFRQHVKALKPDAYIVGEIWHHSGDYLQGDQFDGVMNYHFRDAMIRFFGARSLNLDELDARLTQNRVTYRKQSVEGAWNLLGSHDTSRILNNLKKNKQALKQAYTFQMCYLGMPFIYAGDEIGMEGEDDPDNRRCMIWEEESQDLDLQAHVKKLIKLRHRHEPLRRGEYRTIFKDEASGIFIFERYTEHERVLVVLNTGFNAEEIEMDAATMGFDPTRSIHDAFSDREIKLEEETYEFGGKDSTSRLVTGKYKLTVDAASAAILVQ